MRCFISSCLLKGFQFCYSFLVCNLRRLCSERDFIVFFSIVIYLVVLSGCVLLGLFMWRHRELFFSWDHGGRQCWGVRKSDGILEHKIPEQTPESRNREGTRNPQKSILVSKVVNPFTRALEPPFIGRRRDFYIPRLPSNLENIPSVNTYMNVFYIPWFVGLISSFTSLPLVHTLNTDFWGDVFDLVSHRPSKLGSWRSPLVEISELRFLELPEFREFMNSWVYQISVALKQIADFRSKASSAIISHDVRRSTNHVNHLCKNSEAIG
jgi:hypothetical protein